MLSFPASDPPAVFVDERAPSHRARPKSRASPMSGTEADGKGSGTREDDEGRSGSL